MEFQPFFIPLGFNGGVAVHDGIVQYHMGFARHVQSPDGYDRHGHGAVGHAGIARCVQHLDAVQVVDEGPFHRSLSRFPGGLLRLPVPDRVDPQDRLRRERARACRDGKGHAVHDGSLIERNRRSRRGFAGIIGWQYQIAESQIVRKAVVDLVHRRIEGPDGKLAVNRHIVKRDARCFLPKPNALNGQGKQQRDQYCQSLPHGVSHGHPSRRTVGSAVPIHYRNILPQERGNVYS